MTAIAQNAGLYIHVPFCSSVCPYCDFEVTIAGEERRSGYLSAIEAEASLYSDLGLEFDTVYLGGGTPSSLAADDLEALLRSVRTHLNMGDDAVWYLEVNPEDVDHVTAGEWRRLGFESVSLGVQSLDDEILGFLGRRHSAAAAREAVDVLRRAGFGTVSIDLIYAVGGQSADQWRVQLSEATALSPDHLSCYQLTLHPGTVFGKRMAAGLLKEPEEDTQAELFFLTHEVLADFGYEGYEVSNFASAPEHRSRHNTKYWTHAPYLGLGPSAHSFLGSRRWWNRRKVRLWQRALAERRSPVAASERLTAQQLALETVMLGLRTTEGIDLARLRHDHGLDLVTLNRATIEHTIQSGLLRFEAGWLRPTLEGLAVADSLARLFTVTNGVSTQ